MRKIIISKLFIIVIIVFLHTTVVLSGCDKSNPTPSNSESNHTATPIPPDGASDDLSNSSLSPDQSEFVLQEKLDEMSLEEKIGQLVIVGLEGNKVNAITQNMIEKFKVGGFILYKNNLKSAEQTLALLNELKKINDGNKSPLWLSVDQEGGKVSRLPSEFDKIPSAGAMGETKDTDFTFGIGQVIGEELRSLGFNMNFSPVLDINSNPKNPVIGDRSFGSDPVTVTDHGMALIEGLTSKGVAAVAKHFPGHGDTSVDSHFSLPIVNKTLEELEQFELIPFVEAIHLKVDAIMIAHLLMLELDDKQPSSISKTVITDVLRDKLGYDGVVITDDMTMGGLLNGNSIGDAAIKSILAGSDIILVGHNPKLQLEVLEALKRAASTGAISEERLDQSVYHVLRLKDKYKLKDTQLTSVDVHVVNQSIKQALGAQ